MDKIDPEGKESLLFEDLPVGELFVFIHPKFENREQEWFCGKKLAEANRASRVTSYTDNLFSGFSYPDKEFFMSNCSRVMWIRFDKNGEIFIQ